MGLFSRKKSSQEDTPALHTMEEYPSGPVAGRFFAAVDRAASIQEPAVRSYVKKLSEKHSARSIEERQEMLDKHFRNIATGSGLGTGGLAAWPGIGTLASLGGIAGESILLLEACGLYALASAELHGVDISNEQYRRALIYVTVSGASTNDLVQALTADGALTTVKSLRSLKNAPAKELVTINSTLGKLAFKQMRKKFSGALMRKILPFGVGAVLGARANRKIANHMVKQVHSVIADIKAASPAE